MKKILTISALVLTLLSTSKQAFAANLVSDMAVSKGGQHVAQCAQQMNKGVSECAKLTECQGM